MSKSQENTEIKEEKLSAPEAVDDPSSVERGQAEDSATADNAGQALADAQKKAGENWDLYLRTAAELENVRKRAAREVENARRYGVERIAREILTVKDSLEMGLEAAAEKADVKSLLQGKKNTLKQIDQLMGRFEITEIDPVGEAFDPEYHEAMAMQPSSDHEPGTVITVVQKGYRIYDRLLRPARVLIASEATE